MRSDFPFRPASLPFFYGWVILGVSTLGILMSIPGQTMGVSLFTDPLIEALGITRIEISNAYLVGTLVSGLLLPWGGRLADRMGSRRGVVVVCLGLGATLVMLASADRIAAALADAVPALPRAWWAMAVLALGFTGVRFSGQGMLTLVSRTMLARWWDRRRGLISAISGPFVNFGFAIAPMVLSAWIARAGWRGAWLEMAAGVAIGMGVIGWLLYRDDPESCGLEMDGVAAAPASGELAADAAPIAPARDATRAEALRTPAFWLVTLAIANQALVGTGITFHIVDLGAEHGLSEAQAVSIFLPVAVVSTVLGFAAGAAIDRFTVRVPIMVMMFGQAVMFVGTAHLGDPWFRVLAIAGWGLSSAFYGPLMVAALPSFFGRTHLGAIQGVMTMVLVLASALGPAALAAFEQQAGSYRPGLYAMLVLPALVFAAAPFTPLPGARRNASG